MYPIYAITPFNRLAFSLRKIFSKTKVKLLAVGVNKTTYSTDFPGAKKAIKQIYREIKPRCKYSKLLVDEQTTIANFKNELTKIMDADLSILVYNGHGMQQKAKSDRKNEVDGKDELLCLYDGCLIDNEIWKILQQAKGRVFLVFDCCSSGTMFRESMENFMAKSNNDQERRGTQENPDVLCWSACGDGEDAYALDDKGGMFVKRLLGYISFLATYEKIWKKLSTSRRLLNYNQVVVQNFTRENSNFKGKKLFS